MDKKILIGELTAPHGVRGLMRLRSFAEQPDDIFSFKNLTDAAGVPVTIARRGALKNLFIVAVTGVDSCDAAVAQRGRKLYVKRAALPATTAADQFYISDLEGIVARTTDSQTVGTIARVLDYGAGPVLEISRTAQSPLLLPFTNAFVPTVDMASGFIVINMPVEVE